METAEIVQETKPLSYMELPAKMGGRGVFRENKEFKAGTQLFKIPVGIIQVREGFNIRKHFDENKLNELAEDIKVNGLKEPLVGDMMPDGSAFYLTDGERRIRAIRILIAANVEGFEMVEVRPNPFDITEEERLLYQLSSGNKAEYLPVEIAEGLLRLKENFGHSNIEISKLVGKSRQWVDNMIRLAKQPDEVKDKVAAGEVKATNAVLDTRKKREKPAGVFEGDDEPAPLEQISFLPQLEAEEEQEQPDKLNEAVQGFVEQFKKGQIVVAEKTNLATDVTGGILPKSIIPTTKDRTIGGGGSDMMHDLDLSEISEAETRLKNIRHNITKIEGLGKGLNEQAQHDLHTFIGWIMTDVEALQDDFSKKKNRF